MAGLASKNTERSEARKVYETLKDVDFLNALKVEEMDELITALRKRRFPAGALVFKQGDPGDALYLVGSGHLNMTVRKNFRQNLVRNLLMGDYFGESALMNDGPRAASVTALIESELYILHNQDFQNILLKNPAIAAALKAHQKATRDLRESA